MHTTSSSAHGRFPRTAKLVLVGATVAAGATGFAVLGAGTAFAQASRATLAVAHEHTAPPDHGRTDRHVQKETSRASLDRSSTVTVDRSSSRDRPSAVRLEHKSTVVAQRSDSSRSLDRTSSTGTAVTYDR